jgi:branched-chain amino acid transport system substrate-binding protein
MEVYKDLPIVIITPTASEVSITQRGYRNFFRVNANDITQARVDADFLVNTLGARLVAVVYNDDPYGQGLGALIADNLRNLGAQVPVEIQVAVEQSIFTEEVQRIAEVDPDAIFYGGYEIEAPFLRAELVEAGIAVPFLASDGAFLSATIDDAGGAAEGIYVSAFAPSPAAVVDKQWVREYQEVDYRNPDTYSINGYSAMQVLAEGIKKAKSFDAAEVAQAIRQLDFDALMGNISYDQAGDLKEQSIYIYQVQDAAFVQIHPGP